MRTDLCLVRLNQKGGFFAVFQGLGIHPVVGELDDRSCIVMGSKLFNPLFGIRIHLIVCLAGTCWRAR